MKRRGPRTQDGNGREADDQSENLRGRDHGDFVTDLLGVQVVGHEAGRLLDGVGRTEIDESELVVIPHDDAVDEVARQVLGGQGVCVLGRVRLAAVNSVVLVAARRVVVEGYAEFVDAVVGPLLVPHDVL